MRFTHVAVLSLTILMASPLAQAETLTLEAMERLENQPVIPLTAEERRALANKPIFTTEMPGKGMCMDEVEQRFGPPMEKAAPVGNPPITRWVYEQYTVYFEHRCVIHAVLN